jgi:hypothetical protein
LWPGTTDTVRAREASLNELIWGGAAYSVEKARSELGLVTSYDFAAFLDAWRSGRVGHYQFADEPWWGADRPNP